MSQSTGNDLPLAEGAAAGAAAWIVGVIVLYVIGIAEVSMTISLFIGLLGFAGVLLLYLGFHVWMLGDSGMSGADGIVVFTLLPIVLLLAAGYFVAGRGDPADAAEGFKQGATVTVGYLAMTILTLLYFVAIAGSSGGGASNGGLVDLVLVIGIAGVVFPVVFGGLGGVVSQST